MLNVNNKTGEIFLYGVVGGGMFDDGFTDGDVGAALKELGKKRATVRINSPGGSADMGIAIYNVLREHEAGVDTVVDSLAASAASVIALAGENRRSSIGSRWMLHQALTFDIGNSTQLRKTADILDTYDKSLVEIYSQYMPIGTDVMAILQAETWYTSEEAITAGLATETSPKTDQQAKIASWFRNPPAALLKEIGASMAMGEMELGDRVQVRPGMEHDGMEAGMTGTIEIIGTSALGIKFDGQKDIHKWYVADELMPMEDEMVNDHGYRYVAKARLARIR